MVCLPKDIVKKFIDALKDGTIDPDALSRMSSAERRTFFDGIVGKDSAKDVNALFESKLLLKDQQTGMVNWAREVAGKKPDAVRVFCLVISDNLPGAVAGIILANQQFEIEVGLLHQHALDRLRDERSMVESDERDGDFHGTACLRISAARASGVHAGFRDHAQG